MVHELRDQSGLFNSPIILNRKLQNKIEEKIQNTANALHSIKPGPEANDEEFVRSIVNK